MTGVHLPAYSCKQTILEKRSTYRNRQTGVLFAWPAHFVAGVLFDDRAYICQYFCKQTISEKCSTYCNRQTGVLFDDRRTCCRRAIWWPCRTFAGVLLPAYFQWPAYFATNFEASVATRHPTPRCQQWQMRWTVPASDSAVLDDHSVRTASKTHFGIQDTNCNSKRPFIGRNAPALSL